MRACPQVYPASRGKRNAQINTRQEQNCTAGLVVVRDRVVHGWILPTTTHTSIISVYGGYGLLNGSRASSTVPPSRSLACSPYPRTCACQVCDRIWSPASRRLRVWHSSTSTFTAGSGVNGVGVMGAPSNLRSWFPCVRRRPSVYVSSGRR